MPKFLDHHAQLPSMPPEAVQSMVEGVKSGKTDPFGVTVLNVFIGEGKGWCLTEAPDAEAVCKSHEAQGFSQTAENVHPVMALA